jgi:beta-N-acetylhexosaminidase
MLLYRRMLMSLNAHAAAGMVLGGVEGLSPDVRDDLNKKPVEILAEYAGAGIKSFLFPGFLARDPERLTALVQAARQITEDAGRGEALIAIGDNDSPGFGLPFFPQVSTPLGIASLGSAAAAKRAGFFVGSRLASCGVDLVMGPRLDLASDPKDPIGVLDGFGEDARLAGTLGSAYARGLARAGVVACVGRFPGLGATCRDCQEGMAFISLPVERLERCEMRPFKQASSTGVAAMLIGRVLAPSLESEHLPASASAKVIEGRLREELGFRGLVVGDDIEEGEDPGRAAILEALAGCDLCLFSRPKDALAAAAALEKATETGELPCIRVETARRRLERLSRSRLSSPRRSDANLRALRRDIEKAICRLRGSLVVDGAVRGVFDSILIVVFLPPAGAPDLSESDAVLSAIRSELPGAEVVTIPAAPGHEHTEVLAKVLESGGRFDEAVIFTYDAHIHPAQESMAKLVEESLPRFRVVAMRDPYDAAFFPRAVGLGAAYGFSEACARSAARVLAGKAKACGGQPVEVIGLEV